MITLKQASLLIVDDQEVNIHLLRRILQMEGFEQIISTTDSRQAADIYLQHQPDLVLLDLNMPHMDGFSVLEALHTLPGRLKPNVLVLTAQSETSIRVRALQSGARDFLSKPFDRQEVISRIRNLLENHLLQKALQQQNDHLETQVAERTQQVKQTQLEALNTLGRAAEFRDNETGMHVIRVGKITALLVKAAGLDEQMQGMLRLAAPMHDIGKIGIPDHILLKPGKLTDEEFAISHHEKWDGSGYPNRLAGDAIPLSGRLVALADVFDALTSARPYKSAWPMDKVRQFIRDQSGTHFDPVLAALFDQSWHEVQAIKARFADPEETA